MLQFIERHVVGILTTIIIHLLILTVFMIVQFNTPEKKHLEKQQVVIDFVDPEELQKQIEEKKTQIKQLAQQELVKDIRNQNRNIAVNEAEKAADQSIDKMVNDIKGELNIKDNVEDPNAIAAKLEEKKEKQAETQVEKKPKVTINEKGERTFFKGNTTISFSLEGRTEVYLPIPVYKCQGSGKVVMDITVNPNGFVTSATVNKAESKINEDCLVEAANRAALTSRFTAKGTAPEKQKGRITYIFIAQ